MEMKNRYSILILHVLLLCFSLNSNLCVGGDTISANESLSFNQIIVSSGGNFELGFFSPGNSQKYYIGIWYKKSVKLKAILSSITTLMVLLIGSFCYIYYRRIMAERADRRKGTQGAQISHWHKVEGAAEVLMNENNDEIIDVPYFHLETILAATDNFSNANNSDKEDLVLFTRASFQAKKKLQ